MFFVLVIYSFSFFFLFVVMFYSSCFIPVFVQLTAIL